MKNLKKFILILLKIGYIFGYLFIYSFTSLCKFIINLFTSLYNYLFPVPTNESVVDEAKFVLDQLKARKNKVKESAEPIEPLESTDNANPATSEDTEAPVEAPVEIKPKTYTKEELLALEKKEIFSSYLETKSFYMLGTSISGKDHSVPKVINDELTYMPCQDFYKIDYINNYNIIVCADGAGSATNSLIGSQFIAETAVLELKKLFNTNNVNFTKKKWEESLVELLYRVRNRLKTFGLENEIPFESMASTINITVFDTNTIYYGHIGDGRSCYLTDGVWHGLITPWKGPEANLTVFITSPIWNDPFTYIKTDIIKCESKIQAVSSLTDGCELHAFTINKYVDNKIVPCNEPYAAFYNHVLETVKKLKNDNVDDDKILETWVDFIDKGNTKIENETDDKTMVIAFAI